MTDEDARPRVLVVEVGATAWAWPVSVAREIVRRPPITPIPGAPAVALGLINVRGLIVTTLDGGRLLAPPTAGPGRDGGASQRDAAADPPRDDSSQRRRGLVVPSVVLLEHRGHTVGVSVDAVLGVYPLMVADAGEPTTDRDDARPTGDDVVRQQDAHVPVATLGVRVVHLLDPEALLAHVVLSPEDGR
jgi:chemotaxis signal transduction protein